MQKLVVLLLSCVIPFPLATGCENVEDVKKVPSRTMNIDDPLSFVKENYDEKILENPGEFGLVIKALEGQALTKLIRDKRELVLKTETVCVSRTDSKFTLKIDSSSMSLDDAMKVASEICELIGRDTTKLREWRRTKAYEEAGADCLLVQSVNGNSHAVNVRTSFDKQRPWRILYSVSFEPIKEPKADQERRGD